MATKEERDLVQGLARSLRDSALIAVIDSLERDGLTDNMAYDAFCHVATERYLRSASAPAARIEWQDVPVTAARRCGGCAGGCRCGNDGSCGCH